MAVALAVASGASGMSGSPAAPVAVKAVSAAAALDLSLVIQGQRSSLLNQDWAVGVTPPAYNRANVMPSYSNTTQFKGGMTLIATGHTLAAKASSAGANSSEMITATASSSIGSLKTIFSMGTTTLMTITVTRLTSSATYNGVGTSGLTATLGASMDKLTINAPALGINNLTYSGTPTANKVLFQGNHVSVIVDRQNVIFKSGNLVSVQADGVAVHLTNFQYNGVPISGDIVIGSSYAS
jgi:hypothetical protein